LDSIATLEAGAAGNEDQGVTRTVDIAPRRRWAPLGAWSIWALAMLGMPAAAAWTVHLLRGVGRNDLAGLNSDAVPYAVAVVSSVTVGAVLASRRPGHPVGWLLLVLGLSVVTAGAAMGAANYALVARAGDLPLAGAAAVYTSLSDPLWMACMGFILLLTPTGSPPSPRWRWCARVAVAALVVAVVSSLLLPLDESYRGFVNPLVVPVLTAPLRVVFAVSWLLIGLAVPIGAASLVVRFRRARGVERLQLRWLALAGAVAAMAVLAVLALLATGNEQLLGWAVGVCVAVLPLATGAAILRYRLFDLDRIISRTVAYGLLTLLLGGSYAAVVLGIGQLLGRDRSLLVAPATLAVAAAFQPARRRVQQAVDRRFNRRRYDAAQTIQAFALRLRQQVDLDALRGELLAVIDETMQPTHTSLWLRPTRR
jgi:hypothetical protein